MKSWVKHIVWFILSLGIVTGGAYIMDSGNLVLGVLGLFIIYSWCWISCKTKLFETCPLETVFHKIFKKRK